MLLHLPPPCALMLARAADHCCRHHCGCHWCWCLAAAARNRRKVMALSPLLTGQEERKELLQRKAREREEQAQREYEQLTPEQRAKREAKEERRLAKRRQKSMVKVKVG